MRNDMKHIILSAGRTASTCSYSRKYRLEEGEALGPVRESMRKPYRRTWRAKEMRLKLAPLHRFLEAQVGRPWDTVYSEICTRVRGPMAPQILEHVSDWVATNTEMLDGEVVEHSSWWGLRDVAGYYDLYVHPVSRLLCRVPTTTSRTAVRQAHREREQAKVLAVRRDLPDGSQAHCVDRVWYKVRLEPLPVPEKLEPVRDAAGFIIYPVRQYDVLLGCPLSDAGWLRRELRSRYGKAGVYGASKRQLSHKELCDFRLAN